ncbi:MAG TPA: magnesium transporter CorA family protein [Gaiellaceae bacterium]|jgi:magnesium transporter|nr:magnesium transporter CorA family protein [Gaiellaceae bacterium]
MAEWIDLLDPDRDALEQALPAALHDDATQRLLAPAVHDDEPRPKLEGRRTYVFGVFVAPKCVGGEGLAYFQEIDLVLTQDVVVTVRKTPERGEPFDPGGIRREGSAGEIAASLADAISEVFLEAVDALDVEVDQVDDGVDNWSAQVVRTRMKDLRHDLLRVRRALGPTREALHHVVDQRVDLEGHEVFPHKVEVAFSDSYDKLLRAADGLDLARDLLGGARDYHQAKIANDQNEVMKRLTAIASIVLVPTLIVGVYGQNFDHMPELHWRLGYAYSWGLIVVSTAAQLVYFRRKAWL